MAVVDIQILVLAAVVEHCTLVEFFEFEYYRFVMHWITVLGCYSLVETFEMWFQTTEKIALVIEMNYLGFLVR